MLVRHVALVSEIAAVNPSQLTKVAAALQKQVVRDFGPIWGVQATVNAFTRLEDVPLGYRPIIVEQNINVPGAAGVHEDQHGQPFALVQYNASWSLTASHECLEMLADPFGNRMVAGNAPSLAHGQTRVEYLVEVCDPSEASQFAYTVNGIVVSDFLTPHFYDPVANPGTRYSFTGAITQPHQVLRGGYISWHDPISDHWFQRFATSARSHNSRIWACWRVARRAGAPSSTARLPILNSPRGSPARTDSTRVWSETNQALTRRWRRRRGPGAR